MTILDNKGIYYKKASNSHQYKPDCEIYGYAEDGMGYKRVKPTTTPKYRR